MRGSCKASLFFERDENMIVIVEGIDRVGKTTLVKRLERELGFKVYKDNASFKFENMDNENETDKMLKMLQICNLCNCDIIFDRFHWTDMVYGCLNRGYNFKRALENKDKIEMELRNSKAIIILVKPTDITESSIQHGSSLHRHNHLFNMLFVESYLDRYECTYDNLHEAEMWAKEQMNKRLKGA